MLFVNNPSILLRPDKYNKHGNFFIYLVYKWGNIAIKAFNILIQITIQFLIKIGNFLLIESVGMEWAFAQKTWKCFVWAWGQSYKDFYTLGQIYKRILKLENMPYNKFLFVINVGTTHHNKFVGLHLSLSLNQQFRHFILHRLKV